MNRSSSKDPSDCTRRGPRLRAAPFALLLLPFLLPGTTLAQDADEPIVPLRTAVTGSYEWRIDTRSELAQAYFNQGIQMFFSFSMGEAARSFREAARLDPSCAMCFWGEALALGPHLNAGMAPGNAPVAHAAIQRARELAGEQGVTARERALIDAVSARYEPQHDPARRAELDRAYASALADVYEAFPGDLEVASLYAEALMLLDPRRAQYSLSNPLVQEIHEVLEGVLAQDLSHPGACHLYIHATEATERPDKAEACSDLLSAEVPGASHMNHMPSHTYNVVGRWGDAVASNIEAWHSDQRTAWGEGVSYGAAHNLHMLLFSASMDGQGAIAAQAARDYVRMVADGEFYLALVLMRFGRFHEILELGRPPQNPVNRGMWEAARGYAHLRLGDPESARVYLGVVQEIAAQLPPDARWGRPGAPAGSRDAHAAHDVLGTVAGILEAELLREEGRLGEAIRVLEGAVEMEDRFRYDEPEPLVFSSRHWLGALLLEAGRPADAERVYRASLEQHPHNGWALFGLVESLRAQGLHGDADAARERFAAAWTRSDTQLRSSRF